MQVRLACQTLLKGRKYEHGAIVDVPDRLAEAMFSCGSAFAATGLGAVPRGSFRSEGSSTPSPSGSKEEPMPPIPDDEEKRLTLPHHVQSGHRYSLSRAIRRLASGKSVDGLEGETSAELSRRASESSTRPGGGVGIWVPLDASLERRNLTTTTGAGGVVSPDLGVIVDVLRAALVTAQARGPNHFGPSRDSVLPETHSRGVPRMVRRARQ